MPANYARYLVGRDRTVQANRQLGWTLAFVAGAYALLRIWDPDNAFLRESLVGRLMDVIFILFIGYIVYHLFLIWIDTKIAEEAPLTRGRGRRPGRGGRAENGGSGQGHGRGGGR